MTPVVFLVAVRTKNPSNMAIGNSRIAAMAEAGEAKRQREAARRATVAALNVQGVHAADLVPAVVTLTRLSAGRLDAHDGLRSALKRVVDGIAEALGIDDGGPFVSWLYEQRGAPRGMYGVEVRIEKRGADGNRDAKPSNLAFGPPRPVGPRRPTHAASPQPELPFFGGKR